VLAQIGVVVAGVGGDFLAEKGGVGELGALAGKLHFGHDEAFVVAQKLIYLASEAALQGYQPAPFVDGAKLGEKEEFVELLQ